MVDRWMTYALGVQMTFVSALFLLVSGCAHMMDIHWGYDPGWVTLLISGIPIVYGGIYWFVKEKIVTSWLLIAIAMGACIWLGEVFAAAEMAWIIALGEILEGRTVARARRGLTSLLAQAPQTGRRILVDGVHTETVAIESLAVGDILRILPGETIPADGTVRVGTTSVDESMMTGESLPVEKAPGAHVWSGTLNGFGTIDIEATEVGENSTMQRLVRLVQEASEQPAQVQRTVDRWVGYVIPVSIACAVLTGVVNYLWGIPLTAAIYRAVTVLVVFCPCALALATPTAIVAAIAQATKHGIIIKSGAALEMLGRLQALALDKTGTITTGTMAVQDVWAVHADIEEVLVLAASVEARSEHPIGQALQEYVHKQSWKIVPVKEVEVVGGRGIAATVRGKQVMVGNEAYLREAGLILPEAVCGQAERWRGQGQIVIWIARGQEVLGCVSLADTIRPSMDRALYELQGMGVYTTMLTGDNTATAAHVGSFAGVHEVYAKLLPEDKVSYIEEQQRQGLRIGMVGDGINDAAALRKADIGIAMGGTAGDITLEAADIIMPGKDVTRLPYLFALARKTLRTIHINIAIALGLSIIGVVFSFFGWLTPVTGAIVHNAGSILVALHAMALYGLRMEKNKDKIEAVTVEHCIQVHCDECGDEYCVNQKHAHNMFVHVHKEI